MERLCHLFEGLALVAAIWLREHHLVGTCQQGTTGGIDAMRAEGKFASLLRLCHFASHC
jgi:hypothetical protein